MKIVGLWLTALLTVSSKSFISFTYLREQVHTVLEWDGTYGQEVRSLTLPPSSNSQTTESLGFCERVNLHCPFEGELPSWQFTPYVSDIPIYTLYDNKIAEHSKAQKINQTVLQIVADPGVLYSASLFECHYNNSLRRITLNIQGIIIFICVLTI